MHVAETLAPILLLLLLGTALAHIRFLGPQFMADLNKLVFWIALPVLIFRGVAQATMPGDQVGAIYVALLAVTLLTTAAGWIGSKCLRLSSPATGSVMQAAFRGNLAYIGLPILIYSFTTPEREQATATTLLVMAGTTAIYNVLTVIVLQGVQHRLSISSVRLMAWNIVTNPLIIGCVAGIIFSHFAIPLPLFIDRTLFTLGEVAVPVALLCIGGSFAGADLRGCVGAVSLAALIKTGVALGLALVLGKALGIVGTDLRILLVFATCPTAAASYIMAKQMNADPVVAAGAIALSTILSALSLSAALLLA